MFEQWPDLRAQESTSPVKIQNGIGGIGICRKTATEKILFLTS